MDRILLLEGRMARNSPLSLLVVCICSTLASPLLADQVGREISYHEQGTLLSNAGDYDWWHGCSPTSAGMLMGYYDRNGYGGFQYSNLVPGGVAESSTFGAGPYLVNNIIASSGHIADFYSGAYGVSGDDKPAPWHAFDCLADFMGTSQDAVGNPNGQTTFYYWSDGSPFTAADSLSNGVWNSDGLYGIGEYLQYAGYNAATLYTQAIYSADRPNGFTFSEYMAEIDAGRPVLIQLEGHTMFGLGYESANSQIYVYDTWSTGPHTMTWGGSYGGMKQWGVEVLELTGGSAVPLPSPVLGGLGMMVVLLSRRSLLRRRSGQ
jgi:hypothetical protein